VICPATAVTLVLLTGIDGAGDWSRKSNHPWAWLRYRSVLGHCRRSVAGLVPGGLGQLLRCGCPSGGSSGRMPEALASAHSGGSMGARFLQIPQNDAVPYFDSYAAEPSVAERPRLSVAST
jgi:hypothetical protein